MWCTELPFWAEMIRIGKFNMYDIVVLNFIHEFQSNKITIDHISPIFVTDCNSNPFDITKYEIFRTRYSYSNALESGLINTSFTSYGYGLFASCITIRDRHNMLTVIYENKESYRDFA